MDCIFQKRNEFYPREGMTTPKKCGLTGFLRCDAQTSDGCQLLKEMNNNYELKRQMISWNRIKKLR